MNLTFFVLSMYAVGLSSVVGLNISSAHFGKRQYEYGEFMLHGKQGKDLPMGTFVRFRS